jgi:hypothetical protein
MIASVIKTSASVKARWCLAFRPLNGAKAARYIEKTELVNAFSNPLSA